MIDNPSTMLMRGSSHAVWQIGAARPMKHEPMEEDKNDSGLASGSDFHSSSPGSDASQDMHLYPPKPQSRNTNLNRFYSSPIMTQAASMFAGYNHNPLTPPDSEPLVSPKSDKEEKDSDDTITPCASPNQKNEDNQNHLRRLEMTLEKNLGMSSKMSEHSMDEMSNKSDNDLEDFDDSLKVPKVNSHGKIKTFKCKHCDYVANTKTDQWNHNRIHIPPEKILTCPSPGCNFVTEYKHHFEYHLRNHTGSKPFQCKKCDYSCVNKSMLNSHMKSHSSVYRFSCRDCNYATKYCHSLKLHLRRYGHRPSVVLDDEGKPCPDVVIDVYGTRRGPKIKNQKPGNETGSPQLEGLPLGFNLGAAPQQLPVPPYHPLFSGIPAQIMQQLLHQQALAASASAALPMSPTLERPQPDQEPNSVLDLSKPSSEPGPSGMGDQQKNRRKGPAYRIDPSTVAESEDEDEEMSTTMFSNVEAVVQSQEDKPAENVESSQHNVPDSNNNKKEDKTCQYCEMSFGDYVLYTIHMGYHGYNNPYTCNMCGEECSDRISFFLHIARIAHS